MQEAIFKCPPITPEEPQVMLGIQASMDEGLAQEIKSARNEIARMPGLPIPHRAQDLFAKPRGYLFVGINAQDPVARGLGEGRGFLQPVSLPILLVHMRGGGPGALARPITAMRIDDNDLITPPNTLETPADLGLLITGNNDRGDRLHCSLTAH